MCLLQTYSSLFSQHAWARIKSQFIERLNRFRTSGFVSRLGKNGKKPTLYPFFSPTREPRSSAKNDHFFLFLCVYTRFRQFVTAWATDSSFSFPDSLLSWFQLSFHWFQVELDELFLFSIGHFHQASRPDGENHKILLKKYIKKNENNGNFKNTFPDSQLGWFQYSQWWFQVYTETSIMSIMSITVIMLVLYIYMSELTLKCSCL
jgi:hypothetical protein